MGWEGSEQGDYLGGQAMQGVDKVNNGALNSDSSSEHWNKDRCEKPFQKENHRICDTGE